MPLKKTEKAVPNLSVYKQQERRDKDNINISGDCFYSIYWNSVVVFGHCVLFNDSACCNRWKKDIFCKFMQSQSILVVSASISHIKHTFSEDKVCTAHFLFKVLLCTSILMKRWGFSLWFPSLYICSYFHKANQRSFNA